MIILPFFYWGELMKIQVTIKSIHEERPSGHKPTALFAGGIHYVETFNCEHSRKHASLFIAVLDLSANQCGIQTGEFKSDPFFMAEMDKIIKQIESLHAYLTKEQQKLTT